GGCVAECAKAFGGAATESATENETAGDACTSAAGFRKNRKPASFGRAHLARVKRWGKSPPPGWQHPGHGKPRVEQGQIGGEGRPGPYACPDFAFANEGCDPRVGCLS